MNTEDLKIPIDLDSESDPPYKSGWRPAMGWSYMAVCVFDFMIAPFFYTIIQVIFQDASVGQIVPWEPQTIKGGGLYHISMLTIVGVTAYGRTKEKIQRTIAQVDELINITNK